MIPSTNNLAVEKLSQAFCKLPNSSSTLASLASCMAALYIRGSAVIRPEDMAVVIGDPLGKGAEKARPGTPQGGDWLDGDALTV
jgi:hypothetical protein